PIFSRQGRGSRFVQRARSHAPTASHVTPLPTAGEGAGERGHGDHHITQEHMMTKATQIRIPATYMRGGTSKGVFFRLQDLPASCQVPGEARDRLFMRVIGSPDPYRSEEHTSELQSREN